MRPVDGCTTKGALSKWFCRFDTSESMRGYVYCSTISSSAATHAGRRRSWARAATSSTSSHFCTLERDVAHLACSFANASASDAGSNDKSTSERSCSRKQSWSCRTKSTKARCSKPRCLAWAVLLVAVRMSWPSARRRLGCSVRWKPGADAPKDTFFA